MKGCLTAFFKVLLVIIFLSCLGNAPIATIAMLGVTIAAICPEKQKNKRLEEDIKRLKEENIKRLEEEETATKRKEQRQKTIVEARKRPDLFSFDTSAGTEEIGRFAQAHNLAPLIESIQKRYEMVEAALDDAMVVINDDIDQLNAYRAYLCQDVVLKYEKAIQPFKGKMSLLGEKAPKSQKLRALKNYDFPENMHPAAAQKRINQEMQSISSQTGMGINSYISGRGGFSTLKKGDAAAIGIQLVIAFLRQQKFISEQRREVIRLQSEVNSHCEQRRSAISALGHIASEIKFCRKQHDVCISHILQNYEIVEELASKDESLSSLSEYEIETVEAFYEYGKQLKRLIQTNIMKS